MGLTKGYVYVIMYLFSNSIVQYFIRENRGSSDDNLKKKKKKKSMGAVRVRGTLCILLCSLRPR